MLEPELVRGSERRARPDRGLAVGLQRGAATQLAGVSDAGRVRPPSSRAPVADGSVRVAARPGHSFVGARRPPGSYIMTGLKTGGRSSRPNFPQKRGGSDPAGNAPRGAGRPLACGGLHPSSLQPLTYLVCLERVRDEVWSVPANGRVNFRRMK